MLHASIWYLQSFWLMATRVTTTIQCCVWTKVKFKRLRMQTCWHEQTQRLYFFCSESWLLFQTIMILLHLRFLLLAMPGWEFYLLHSRLLWKHINSINLFFVVVLRFVKELSLPGSLNNFLRANSLWSQPLAEKKKMSIGNCPIKLSLTFFQLCINKLQCSTEIFKQWQLWFCIPKAAEEQKVRFSML